RRPGHLDALLETAGVNRIDVVHEERHPNSSIVTVIAIRTPALAVQTQKYLQLARAHRTEVGRAAPVPRLLPSQLLKPVEALLHVRHVQNRRHSLCNHHRSSQTSICTRALSRYSS